jgi:hypothetical protein
VNEPGLDTQRKILAVAAVLEAGTGLALMIDPTIVVRWLLGSELADVGPALARCFGIALVALGLACWPRLHGDIGSSASRGMLIYNALIALYLGYLGAVGHMGGPLLWPVVALHAVVALLLIWTGRNERRTEATHK